MQVGPPPAANTNTASRLPAAFSSCLHSHMPGPKRGRLIPASLGLPDVGRVGGPHLGLRPQDPTEAPARGWPAHWETQPHVQCQSPPLAWPTHHVAVDSFLALCVSCSPRPRPPSSGGVGASKKASVQPRKPCAPGSGPPALQAAAGFLPPGVPRRAASGAHGQAVVVDPGRKRGRAAVGGGRVAQSSKNGREHVGNTAHAEPPRAFRPRWGGQGERASSKETSDVSERAGGERKWAEACRQVTACSSGAQGSLRGRRHEQKCGWGEAMSHGRIQGHSLAAGGRAEGSLTLELPQGGADHPWTPGQDFLLCSESKAGLAEF